MHVTLLPLKFDNSTWWESMIEHGVIIFRLVWRLRYRLYLNLCFSINILYFWPLRRSKVLWWNQISTQCHHYPICMTRNCWCSLDAQCHDGVTKMSCTVWEGHHYMTYELLLQSDTLINQDARQRIVGTSLTLILRMRQSVFNFSSYH